MITTALPTASPWFRRRLTDWLVSILLMQTIRTRIVAWGCALITTTAAHAASHDRRLRRTYQWDVHRAVLTSTLRFTPGERVTVIIDETTHTDQWTLLTAALWYHGRAIPLAWVLHPGNTRRATAFWDDTALLLARVQQCLPATTPVVVVADRAFGCPAFVDQVTAQGWDWVVRIQGQTRIRDARGTEQPIRDLVTRGRCVVRRGHAFKKAHWRAVTIIAGWDHGFTEPLLLVSSLASIGLIRHHYRRRYAIEALFRDWKSAGWQWEASQSRCARTQAALVLGMALATVVLLQIGTAEAATAVAERTAPASPRRPWAARDSLFRLGQYGLLRWLWTGVAPPLNGTLSLVGTALSPGWAETATHGGVLGSMAA